MPTKSTCSSATRSDTLRADEAVGSTTMRSSSGGLPSGFEGVIQRDPEISGLRSVLDDGAALALLRRVGNDNSSTEVVERSRLTYLRYKPGMSCLATRRVSLSSGVETDVYFKALGNTAQGKLEKMQGRLRAGRELWLRPQWVARESVLVSPFPSDWRLDYLSDLFVSGARERAVSRVFPNRPSVWSQTIESIAYKPERRFVGRLEDSRSWYCLKMYPRRQLETFYRRGKAAGAISPKLFPTLAGRSKGLGILAFDWIHGSTLPERLARHDQSVSVIEEVSHRLMELHQSSIRLPVRDRKSERLILEQTKETLCHLVPRERRLVVSLVGRLASWLSRLPESTQVIHGDFYDEQVVATAKDMRFLDMDELARGDRHADLGSFIAHLLDDQNSQRAARAEDLIDALVSGYTAAGGEIDRTRLKGYVAFALLQLAHHPFRNAVDDWEDVTVRLLERASGYVGSASSSVFVPSTNVCAPEATRPSMEES